MAMRLHALGRGKGGGGCKMLKRDQGAAGRSSQIASEGGKERRGAVDSHCSAKAPRVHQRGMGGLGGGGSGGGG